MKTTIRMVVRSNEGEILEATERQFTRIYTVNGKFIAPMQYFMNSALCQIRDNHTVEFATIHPDSERKA